MDIAAVEQKIHALEVCMETTVSVGPDEPLVAGVDLGTAYIVLVVLNANKLPVACAMEFAQVVKDGLVVDYIGATRILQKLVSEVEERLGRKLKYAAIAVPPGTGGKDAGAHRHVVESAGLEVTNILDEPTAANAVLCLKDGAIVDVGGGTTGITVLKNGKVTYVADEATGGTHLSLVLAGNRKISFEEAEMFKRQPEHHKEVLIVVQAVIEKIASIIARHVCGHKVTEVYLVGGTCCLEGMEDIIAREIGLPVYKPSNPLLVTPLGIAMNCSL